MNTSSKKQIKEVKESNVLKEIVSDHSTKNYREKLPKELLGCFDFANDTKVEKELVALLKKDRLTPDEKKERNKLELEIGMTNGLKNGAWVGNLDYTEYFKFLTTTRNNLVKEYDCKTSSELMLVDRIVASYWRAMRNDTSYHRILIKKDNTLSYNQLKINMLKQLTKDIELADRQLNANIILLKEFKQPKLNVKISTDNAYFANNQQVINHDDHGKQNENN